MNDDPTTTDHKTIAIPITGTFFEGSVDVEDWIQKESTVITEKWNDTKDVNPLGQFHFVAPDPEDPQEIVHFQYPCMDFEQFQEFIESVRIVRESLNTFGYLLQFALRVKDPTQEKRYNVLTIISESRSPDSYKISCFPSLHDLEPPRKEFMEDFAKKWEGFVPPLWQSTTQM